jgi:hypothetical protein
MCRASYFFDVSPQPKPEKGLFFITDASSLCFEKTMTQFGWVFSSHMVEDLPTEDAIVNCLNNWKTLVVSGGFIVLLLPDMQGGRYPTVAQGGNPSHRVDVGVPFIMSILPRLKGLNLVQIDTIPHDKSCTFDVVFLKEESV